MESIKEYLFLRVNKFGVVEIVVVIEGINRVRVDVLGKFDFKEIVEDLSKLGNLVFKGLDG